MILLTLLDVLPIRTCLDLQSIAHDTQYALFNDIDCSGFSFVPVANFHSVLYGYNYTISNLRIASPLLYAKKQYASFIVNTTGASISNLKISNMEINSCGDFCGLLGFGLPALRNINIEVNIRKAVQQAVIGGLIAAVDPCGDYLSIQEYSGITVHLACESCAAKAISAVIGYAKVPLSLRQVLAQLRLSNEFSFYQHAAGLVAVAKADISAKDCAVAANFGSSSDKLVFGGVCALCAVVTLRDCYSTVGNETRLAYGEDFVGVIAAFAAVSQSIQARDCYARVYGRFANVMYALSYKVDVYHSYYYLDTDDLHSFDDVAGMTFISHGDEGKQDSYANLDFKRTWGISEGNQGFPDFHVVDQACASGTCEDMCALSDYFPATACTCPSGQVYSPLVERCIAENCRQIGDIICDGKPDECHFVNATQYCECALNNTCLNGCPYCHGECYIELNGSVVCEQCYVGWTGPACDICASAKCDNTLSNCSTCNGQCVVNRYNETLCLSCNTGWSGLDCSDCADGYVKMDAKCIAPRARSSYLWYIIAIMAIITALFAVLLYFVWKAVNSKEGHLKRVYSCAEHIEGPARPKIKAPLARLLNDKVKLEIPLDVLQPTAKLAPIRTSSRQTGDIVKRVGVNLVI